MLLTDASVVFACRLPPGVEGTFTVTEPQPSSLVYVPLAVNVLESSKLF